MERTSILPLRLRIGLRLVHVPEALEEQQLIIQRLVRVLVAHTPEATVTERLWPQATVMVCLWRAWQYLMWARVALSLEMRVSLTVTLDHRGSASALLGDGMA